LWLFWRFLWAIFDAKRVKHLTLNALGIRPLSCVICGRGQLRSEICAIFEGAKITFVTFLTLFVTKVILAIP